MDQEYLPMTRRETTYKGVGNADIASLHGCNLLEQCILPWMAGSRTMQEQLSRSNCRGANICHPWWLNTRIHAGDGHC